MFELSEKKEPVVRLSGGREFQAEDIASTKPWGRNKLGVLEKKLEA